MAKELNKNTEQNIIEVATELFAKNGFDGTSIRDICKKAEVNISMISYYFGGKKELYEKIVANIVNNIIKHMKSKLGVDEIPQNFDFLSKEQKIELLFKCIEFIVDYFYSDCISDSSIMILYREQMYSDGIINAQGYKIFKKLFASILNKNEDDKEIILRTITIVGQVHSARLFKQFSLKLMGQSGYSKEDVQMLKQIITSNVKAILVELGAI